MSKENPLTSEDYFQITTCINHCIDEVNKLRFVSPNEWERLSKLKNKVEHAYNLKRKEETGG